MALDAHLRKMSCTQSKSDYISGGDKAFFIGVYVDDMVLAGNDKAEIKRVEEELSARFDLKDLGKLNYFLGMSVIRTPER